MRWHAVWHVLRPPPNTAVPAPAPPNMSGPHTPLSAHRLLLASALCRRIDDIFLLALVNGVLCHHCVIFRDAFGVGTVLKALFGCSARSQFFLHQLSTKLNLLTGNFTIRGGVRAPGGGAGGTDLLFSRIITSVLRSGKSEAVTLGGLCRALLWCILLD